MGQKENGFKEMQENLIGSVEKKFTPPKWFIYGKRVSLILIILIVFGYIGYSIWLINYQLTNPVIISSTVKSNKLALPNVFVCASCPYGNVTIEYSNPATLPWEYTTYFDFSYNINFNCVNMNSDKVSVGDVEEQTGIRVISTSDPQYCSSTGVRVIVNNKSIFLQSAGGNMIITFAKTISNFLNSPTIVDYNSLVVTQQLNSNINSVSINYRTIITLKYVEIYDTNIFQILGSICGVISFCSLIRRVFLYLIYNSLEHRWNKANNPVIITDIL